MCEGCGRISPPFYGHDTAGYICVKCHDDLRRAATEAKGSLLPPPDVHKCLNCEGTVEDNYARTIVHDGEKYVMVGYIISSPQGPYCQSCVLLLLEEMNAGFTPDPKIQRAIDIASKMSAYEGDHHKAYVIDQMIRALTGCMVTKTISINRGGVPQEVEVMEVSEEYLRFVSRYEEEASWGWDTGIAP